MTTELNFNERYLLIRYAYLLRVWYRAAFFPTDLKSIYLARAEIAARLAASNARDL